MSNGQANQRMNNSAPASILLEDSYEQEPSTPDTPSTPAPTRPPFQFDRSVSVTNGNGSASDDSQKSALKVRQDQNFLETIAKPHERQLGFIKSVGRYTLKSDWGAGSMGSLFLTNIRLYFLSYNNTFTEANTSELIPPFDIHSFLVESSRQQNNVTSITKYDDSIDFINIYRVEDKTSQSHVTLNIYCHDFRGLKFSLIDSPEVKCFIELLNKLLSSSSNSPSTSGLASSGSSSLFTPSRASLLPYKSKSSNRHSLRQSSSSSNVLELNGRFDSTSEFKPYSSAKGTGKTQVQQQQLQEIQLRNKAPNATQNNPNDPHKHDHELPLLWYILSAEYNYSIRQEWERRESYWLKKDKNIFLRITQCNDTLDLSKTLPRTFVTLASSILSDITLLQSISSQLPCQRVPVICFAYYFEPLNVPSTNIPVGEIVTQRREKGTPPITENENFHLLIRSVTLTEDVKKKLQEAIDPLVFYDVTTKLPSLNSIEKSYAKLHEICTCKLDSDSDFISTSGKWLEKVRLVLSVVKSIVDIITNESSVVLLEENDRCWNPLVSSLVQICIDPDRRTIKGFESLIAKEWLYLTGNSNNFAKGTVKAPSYVMFTLFIDCVHQLMSGDKSFQSFEFTSLFLVRLFDLLFLPSNHRAEVDSGGSSSSFTSSATEKIKDHLTSSFDDLRRIGTKSPKKPGRRPSLNFGKKTQTSGFTCYTNDIPPVPPMRKNKINKLKQQQQVDVSLNNACLTFDKEQGCVNDLPKVNPILPLSINNLTIHQLLFYFNPLFDGGQQAILDVPTCVASLVFFDSLYLRWCCYPSASDPNADSNSNDMSSIYYNMFPHLQQICLEALRSYRTSCGLERKTIERSSSFCAVDASDYYETEL